MAINLNNGLWGDPEKPIVLFFGETGSGKTTALVRLMTYLHSMNYSYDLCDKFHNHYYSNEPISTVHSEFDKQFDVEIQKVEGTALSCFCKIKDAEGTVLCRFLDTPGENLFSVKDDVRKSKIMKNVNSPIFKYQYLNDILDTKDYKKVWIFFMDIDMLLTHKEYANDYIENITRIAQKSEGNENDKMIFVVNKEDRVRDMYGPVLQQGCEAYINNLFNNILARKPFTIETTNFLGLRSKKKHFRAIPFCSYTVEVKSADMEGNQLPTEYSLSSEAYPAVLWQTIQDAFLNKF